MAIVTLDVLVNKKDGGRRVVRAEVLKRNARTAIVRLPDGNIVKRRAGRDYREVKYEHR